VIGIERRLRLRVMLTATSRAQLQALPLDRIAGEPLESEVGDNRPAGQPQQFDRRGARRQRRRRLQQQRQDALVLRRVFCPSRVLEGVLDVVTEGPDELEVLSGGPAAGRGPVKRQERQWSALGVAEKDEQTGPAAPRSRSALPAGALRAAMPPDPSMCEPL